MKIKYIIVALFILMSTVPSFAQDAIVNEYLQQYSQGKMNEVRTALPDLLVEYPNDPGVKLLLAIVLEDADKALEIYKDIIMKGPESPWADDAYWRLVQYFAVKGDVDKAEFELANFRKRYPTSEYLITATDVVRTCRSFINTSEKKAKAAEKKGISESENKTSQKSENQVPKKETGTNDVKSGNYGLQVGVFSTLEKAESEKEKFMSNRLRTSIEEKMVEGKKMFAVVIGNYSSMEAAEAAKQIIQQQCGNCNPVIYQK
jgi:hypothetical protein